MTDEATPINNMWNDIIADAETDPNKDVIIETTDPLFDEQVCRAVFREPEPSDIRDGRGIQVRLSAEIQETITSTDGVEKTSGWVWKGRPVHIKAAISDEKAKQRAEIGCREMASALIAAKLLRRGESPTYEKMVKLLPQLTGSEVVLRFSLRTGNKPGDDGQPVQFQNVRFAPAGTANTQAPAPGDY